MLELNILTLNDLWLHENKIGNVGAHYLADALRKNRGLTDLNLCSNQINDDGTQYLADALRENKTLDKLLLFEGNNISSSLEERLKRKDHRLKKNLSDT
ncbi:unnamed protein product [Rotaria magnacalcarata]